MIEERPTTTQRRWRDPRGFQELMLRRVQNILLVSSLYDSFTLAEDGQVAELFVGQFLDLNLLHVPDLTRVSTGGQALRRVRRERGRFDLIITSMNPGDMSPLDFARRVADIDPELPVVLLGYDNRDLTDFMNRHDTSPIERAFLWQGDVRILLAISKYIEDKWNAAHDCGDRGVQAVVVVEDNVRYYSSFLPMIYTELYRQTQGLLSEGLNLSQKRLRMRARPKILLCDHYEEAWNYVTRFGKEVLGVVSDIEFPREGVSSPEAGIELARRVRKLRDDVPILLQSSRPENEAKAEEVHASFLLKGSPVLLQGLRGFMYENFAFGDFIFRSPDGSELGRAVDLQDLERKLHTMPAESLAFHGEHNHFSRWLKARTEFGLAHKLRPQKVTDFSTLEELRVHMITSIREYRRERGQGIVADFDAHTFDPASSLARIGAGSLGGKARGLAFGNYLIGAYGLADMAPGVHVAVPPAVVLASGVFERFLEVNDLGSFALECDDDEELARRFQEARFPDDIHDDIVAYMEMADYPLAVRSSSLLEDSQYQPLAGVYETYMLPNNDPDPNERRKQLLRTVKRVYASTFSRTAKNFLRTTTYRLEEEKMAVIVQKIVGTRHGHRFYPDFSGVARSHNFYPTPPMTAEDGISAVGLGFGKAVVEGEPCLRFSPRHPHHVPALASPDEALKSTQRNFYALELEGGGESDDDPSLLLRSCGLDAAEKDGVLGPLGSTYSPESEAVYDGISRPGPRLVSFAGVLKHGVFPLSDILNALGEMGTWATAGPVEFEFAVNLSTPPGQPKEFGFLQMRPLSFSADIEEVDTVEPDPERILCESSTVMGNGKVGLRDIVVVDAERFDRARSREAALDVARYNAELSRQGLPYLLIGVGRWGSADPWLGIPVTWNQISGARVIVETGFKDFRVEPSQGTHFFQNLSSCNVGYFTVNPEMGDGFLDWTWLAAQDALEKSTFVRHLRLEDPVIVVMNGKNTEGIILKP